MSFEAREALLAGLGALRAHASFPLELVVVDNASTDGSADAVRAAPPGGPRHRQPGERRLRARLQPGLARFARAARALPEPGRGGDPGRGRGPRHGSWRAGRTVGAAGPRTRGSDGTIQVSTGPDLTPLAERRQRRLVLGVARRDARALAEAEALHAREHEPAWVSGSCLIARRAGLVAVSGFDERFFLYEEDADLCRRLRSGGWRVVFTPAAEVRHHLGRSMAKAPRRAPASSITAATCSTTASTTGRSRSAALRLLLRRPGARAAGSGTRPLRATPPRRADVRVASLSVASRPLDARYDPRGRPSEVATPLGPGTVLMLLFRRDLPPEDP